MKTKCNSINDENEVLYICILVTLFLSLPLRRRVWLKSAIKRSIAVIEALRVITDDAINSCAEHVRRDLLYSLYQLQFNSVQCLLVYRRHHAAVAILNGHQQGSNKTIRNKTENPQTCARISADLLLSTHANTDVIQSSA
jgi:hypothetical protein